MMFMQPGVDNEIRLHYQTMLFNGSKIMSLDEIFHAMRKESLNPPPADKRIYKKIDESCKYSPLRDPVHCSNGFYYFSTYEQMFGSFMDHRLRYYLKTEFRKGGSDPFFDKAKANDLTLLTIRNKITNDYIKAHAFPENPDGTINIPPVYNNDYSPSWISDFESNQFNRKNYYQRRTKDSKTYFDIVYDRYLLTFLHDDGTYRNPRYGRYNEVVFSSNVTGLRDYDVLARADQAKHEVSSPLSMDFCRKFDTVYWSNKKHYTKILHLGVRSEDDGPLSVIVKLEAKQNVSAAVPCNHLKRFIFYALLFYHPDFYSADFRNANLNDEAFYGTAAEFDEICKNFSSTDFEELQPLCTKHRFLSWWNNSFLPSPYIQITFQNCPMPSSKHLKKRQKPPQNFRVFEAEKNLIK